MKDLIYHFLQRQWDGISPVLIAVSGGPDSLALLHMFLHEKRLHPTLAIAHIDHGWRKESRAESEQLEALAKEHKIPFHIQRLDPSQLKGNLEAACREERLNFFKTLLKSYNYQAVVLGHHSDDQAETVLKKLFEYTAIPALKGMQEESIHEGFVLWRPLLNTPKKEILKYINVHDLKPFDDVTNRDTRFLRARMREKLLPELSELFGKDIKSALCRIGHDATDFSSYLDKKIAIYSTCIEENAFGSKLDLRKMCPEETLELKHLLRTFFKRYGLQLSLEALQTSLTLLMKNAANKQIKSGNHLLHIDRKIAFLTRDIDLKGIATSPSRDHIPVPAPGEELQWADWHVSVTQGIAAETPSYTTDWEDVWDGVATVTLPLGQYYLANAAPNDQFPGNSPISKLWNNLKVPTFLRDRVPVVLNHCPHEGKQTIVHEFLSGRRHFSTIPGCKVLNLVLIRKV